MVGSGNRHRQQLIKKPSLARKSPMVEGHLGRARPARPPPQRPPSVASAHGQSAELRILRRLVNSHRLTQFNSRM